MFIHNFAGGLLWPTGILHAHRAYGRRRTRPNEAEPFPHKPGTAIEVARQRFTNTIHASLPQTIQSNFRNAYPIRIGKNHFDQFSSTTRASAFRVQSILNLSPVSLFHLVILSLVIIPRFVKFIGNNPRRILRTVVVSVYVGVSFGVVYIELLTFICLVLLESDVVRKFSKHLIFGCVTCRISHRSFVSIGVFIVCALYAGTLVAFRTTALSNGFRSSSAQLAALCFIVAILTLAARCYASTSATHPIVQFSHHRSPITIEDSQSYSSRLVLSRFTNSNKAVQSDTRVKHSKSYNQNYFTSRKSKYVLRTKREFHTVRVNSLNDFGDKKEDFSYATFREGLREVKTNEVFYKSGTGAPSKVYNNKISASGTAKGILRVTLNKSAPNYVRDASPPLKRGANVSSVSANSSAGAWNTSESNSRVSNRLGVTDHQNDLRIGSPIEQNSVYNFGTQQPMPPAHDRYDNTLNESGVFVLVVSVLVLTVALGLVTCVLSHYRGGTAANPHDAAQTPTTAPMLSVVSAGAAAGVGGMDRLRSRGTARELAATRDRQVRVHAVRTDLAINLPPSIAMPDGEEHPFTSSRLHIRDAEQESEIHQKCIKPPPNRTVLESESPPPYRSSSAGLLGSISGSSSGSSDWSGGSASLVVRCNSMSSTSKRPEATTSSQKTDFLQKTVKIFTSKKSQPPPPSAPSLPVVIVPSKPRRTPPDQQNSTGRPKPSV